MTDEEIIEVVQASKEGKEIQVKSVIPGNPWFDCVDPPKWNFERFIYRVRPKPKYGDKNIQKISESLSESIIDFEHDLDVENICYLSTSEILQLAELIQSDIDNGFIEDPRK